MYRVGIFIPPPSWVFGFLQYDDPRRFCCKMPLSLADFLRLSLRSKVLSDGSLWYLFRSWCWLLWHLSFASDTRTAYPTLTVVVCSSLSVLSLEVVIWKVILHHFYFGRNTPPWPTILGDWLVILSVRDFRRFSPLHFGYSISYLRSVILLFIFWSMGLTWRSSICFLCSMLGIVPLPPFVKSFLLFCLTCVANT